MRRKSALIGLAVAATMASGLAAGAGASPNLYYDLSPAAQQNAVSNAVTVAPVTNSAAAAAAPDLYYDL